MENFDLAEKFIGTLGFPIFMVVVLLFIAYKMMGIAYKLIVKSKEEAVTRENTIREEAIAREDKIREEAGIHEQKLMEALNNQANVLRDISNSLSSFIEVNREISDTNKQLASKIDLINEKLINIDNKVDGLINSK